MRCALEAAAVRVAPSMNAQGVANASWALATLGWQAGEGSVRCALEAAEVRVAPSMNAQDVAKRQNVAKRGKRSACFLNRACCSSRRCFFRVGVQRGATSLTF
jgi:hypothetical protein